ncbi:carbohydrate kinase family protein [Sebaldella sp. S0638]|uniref:carbohydrate kinase family protein n=1 Tax=Sebaldella sp. S0638 TaxID=2957809 RepID=UPI0020A19346|nr:sugar kinase [Sebaldella sp. S0638]MCP1224450.1 sugar kinase [Sebaldella sp. S0638]
MPKILTAGEVLVEIMGTKKNQTFRETGEFTGPYPSGAPAIFIDQAAKMGGSTGIISVIGNDDFGRINTDRLKKDGVDVSQVYVSEEKTTAAAFVVYQESGSRDFIFTIKDSALQELNYDKIDKSCLDGCEYFHIMGCSVFNENMIDLFNNILPELKGRGIKVTFDPNFRKEFMENPRIKELIVKIMQNADIILPGEQELLDLTGMETEKEAVKKLLEDGTMAVVVKRGDRGATLYSETEQINVDPVKVEEVDPTGAGDCFGGTFVSLVSQGYSYKEALFYANLAGAYSVTKQGPMEGNLTKEEIDNIHKK